METDEDEPSEEDLAYEGSTADHRKFLRRICLISLVMLPFCVGQWYFLLKIDLLVRVVHEYQPASLAAIFLCFVLFLSYVYSFRLIDALTGAVWLKYLFLLMVVEFSGGIVIPPLLGVIEWRDLAYASAVTISLPVISLIVSIRHQVEFGFESDFIMLWSLRYFFVIYVGVVVTMATKNPYIELWFALFSLMFLFLFVTLFSLTLGNKNYFLRERPAVLLYGLLSYFNYMSVFAALLLLLEKVHQIPRHVLT